MNLLDDPINDDDDGCFSKKKKKMMMMKQFSPGRSAQFNQYLLEIFHIDLSTRNVIQPLFLIGRNL